MGKSVKKAEKKTNKFLEMVSKYKLYIFSIVFVILFVALYVVFGLKDRSYAIDTDHLILECPSTARAGEEISCTYGFNVVSIIGQAFQVKPVIMPREEASTDTNLTFLGHDNDGICGSTCVFGTEGLVYFSMEANLNGRNIVGNLRYKIPDEAQVGEEYGIALIDGMLAGEDNQGNEAEINYNEVNAVVRVVDEQSQGSDVNTLTGITLSSGTLNEQVTTDRTNYTATVNSDKVTISVTKSDNNSSIDDNLENISLHYGTNEITFSVFSESGLENPYTITITRPYEFTDDYYVYNKNDNYLYTRTDTDNETIISNISLESGLSGSISNGKYIVKYGNETLKSINIVNVDFGDYELVDGTVYLGELVSVSSFKSDIDTNGVIVKVYNGNNEVTSGNLSSNYKVRVYHGSTMLEAYDISMEYLSFSDDLIVDDVNEIIKRLDVGTTYSELKDNIETSGTIVIKDKNGNTLSNSDKVKTGDVVRITVDGETYDYTISVLGDVNGDGTISTADVTRIYRNVKGKVNLSEEEEAAGDTINDGSIQTRDVTRLYRYVKGKINEL